MYVKSSIVRQTIRWEIIISPQDHSVLGSTILDTKSQEYKTFIQSVINALDSADYLHNDDADHSSSNANSQSMYYEFLKFTGNLDVKVLLHVRVSDHLVPDKHKKTASQERQDWLDNSRSVDVQNDFKSKIRPTCVPVEIIFNDSYYTSYKEALNAIMDMIQNDLP